ncbi:hypothetical protein SAMN06265337_2616 [Hymenobacter gelipurpurascens]|uniref:Uncharacterized protein n=1 Tax=Hymenobacter gelipurpurascens TaxID=89968 RepID=A0A212UA49_9BACT|nr:hypothetical protein SAMN06265337_2616 [Hymenobacter gelipurpurascens]
MAAITSATQRFYRYVAAEVCCLLLSYIPWVFVLTLPMYLILAAQLYFFREAVLGESRGQLRSVFPVAYCVASVEAFYASLSYHLSCCCS